MTENDKHSTHNRTVFVIIYDHQPSPKDSFGVA